MSNGQLSFASQGPCIWNVLLSVLRHKEILFSYKTQIIFYNKNMTVIIIHIEQLYILSLCFFLWIHLFALCCHYVYSSVMFCYIILTFLFILGSIWIFLLNTLCVNIIKHLELQKDKYCIKSSSWLLLFQVLCIDEATASVDQETDRLVQVTIRQEFASSTVLTIAHRINTVLDSDRVLVMKGGMVAELAPPDELLQDSQSLFYQLVHGRH